MERKRFLIKCDNIKVIKTNRKKHPLDVYIDNNPLIFMLMMATPGLGLIIFLLWVFTAQRNRRKGKILINTT